MDDRIDNLAACAEALNFFTKSYRVFVHNNYLWPGHKMFGKAWLILTSHKLCVKLVSLNLQHQVFHNSDMLFTSLLILQA